MMASTLAVLLWQCPMTAIVPAPRAEEVRTFPSLAGTTWAGDGAVAYTLYRFEPDGVLSYSYNQRSYRNGTWQQDGVAVYFQCNNRYYEFKGRIQGNQISGRSWNVKGERWVIRFSLQSVP